MVTEDEFEGVEYLPTKICPCVSVESWMDFFSIAEKVATGKWIFRGHESASWRLRTALEREHDDFQSYDSKHNVMKCKGHRDTAHKIQLRNTFDFWAYELALGENHESEMYAITRFRELVGNRIPQGMTDIECLATMQHYGTKTRLLDFTSSIMVALYFAYEKRLTMYEELKDKQGKSEHEKSVDLRRSIYAVNLEAIINSIDSIHSDTIIDRELTCRDIANKNICGEQDGVGVLPIWTVGNNPRSIAQSGMFLLPLSFDKFEKCLAETLNLETTEGYIKLVDENNECYKNELSCSEFRDNFSGGWKIFKINLAEDLERNAWEILDLFNITPYQMFPDVVGIAKSIRYKKLYPWR